MMKFKASCRGATALALFMLLCGSALAQTRFSYAGPPVSIPDASDLSGNNPGAPAVAPTTVFGLIGAVTKITVSLDGSACSTTVGSTTVGIEHTFVEDLKVSLQSPAGTTVLIINEAGGSGNNFCQTVLDDTGAQSIQTVSSSAAPFTGTFSPNSPLSAFNGQAPNGDWKLLVQDFLDQDGGNIRAWSVTVSTTGAVPALSGWGMTLLVATLSISGLAVLRRRAV